MVQPKAPPLSFRLAPDLVAKVEAWAKKRKITRNAAVAQLLEMALDTTAQKLPGEMALQQSVLQGYLGSKVTTTRQLAEMMVAPKPKPIHVSAPQLGTFERKPYQKGTKK